LKRPSARTWALAAAGVAVVAALIALSAGHAAGWADSLEDTLEARGLVTGVLVFCAASLVGTLLLVPAWIFPIAGGAAFGFGWGLLASIVAQALAAQCAFFLARHVLRARIARAAKRYDTFKAVDKAVKREPRKVVALLRLSPVLPSGLKSYFLGLTGVRALDYAAASSAAMAPTLALKVYVGAAGRDALASGGPLEWAVLGAGIAATLAIGLFVGRFAKRTLGF
jgi:uncharacterized membrane protein YdjX (TVP38/TMEM64 family)